MELNPLAIPAGQQWPALWLPVLLDSPVLAADCDCMPEVAAADIVSDIAAAAHSGYQTLK